MSMSSPAGPWAVHLISKHLGFLAHTIRQLVQLVSTGVRKTLPSNDNIESILKTMF